MKNLSLALNGILLIAVGFLYYLHFNASAKTEAPAKAVPLIKVPSKGAKMVYVNADSLFENYTYYKKVKLQMEAKRKSAQENLAAKGKSIEEEYYQYQQKAAGMTADQRQKIEQALGKKQQDFIQSREDVSRSIEEEEGKIHEALYDKIGSYLKAQSQNGYEMVFGYSKGGGILYATDSLNITSAILKGLNEAYEKEVADAKK